MRQSPVAATAAPLLAVAFALALPLSDTAAQTNPPLPAGFVHLRQVDPTIVEDIRYATALNFTGARVPGYDASTCILRREAAEALKRVQDKLRQGSLSLKVYDCYRPSRAVRAFAGWVSTTHAPGLPRYHPRVQRRDLIAKGYIGRHSDHAKGIAVDLTLVALPLSLPAPIDPEKNYGPCSAPSADREPDNSLDMGTSFDCFDPLSAPAAAGISDQQRTNRRTLADAMRAEGFRPLSTEWWHFAFTRVPVGLPPHDFQVKESSR